MGFFTKIIEAPQGEEDGFITLLLKALRFAFLLIIILRGYDGIVSFIQAWCLVPVKLSAHLQASYSVVPFLVTVQEIHQVTYVVKYVGYQNGLE